MSVNVSARPGALQSPFGGLLGHLELLDQPLRTAASSGPGEAAGTDAIDRSWPKPAYCAAANRYPSFDSTQSVRAVAKPTKELTIRTRRARTLNGSIGEGNLRMWRHGRGEPTAVTLNKCSKYVR